MTYSLRDILTDHELAAGFADFCRVQHATENLDFWLAVEQFKLGFAAPPPASPTRLPRSTSSSAAATRESDSSDGTPTTASPSSFTRKRGTITSHLRLLMLPRTGSKSRLVRASSSSSSSTPAGAAGAPSLVIPALPPQQLAQFIFDEFLQPTSSHWVCHDHRLSDRLKESLERGDPAEQSWFDALQAKVFTEMEKDLVIRFNQAFLSLEEDISFLASSLSGGGGSRRNSFMDEMDAEKDKDDGGGGDGLTVFQTHHHSGGGRSASPSTLAAAVQHFTISPQSHNSQQQQQQHAVAGSSPTSRGSTRFFPDPKLRQSMQRAASSSSSSKRPSQLSIMHQSSFSTSSSSSSSSSSTAVYETRSPSTPPLH